jgi:hypothetical protein
VILSFLFIGQFSKNPVDNSTIYLPFILLYK